MQLPFFYIDEYDVANKEIKLDEDTSRHIVQVLRMKKEGQLNLTDGKGQLITAEIIDDHKKHCIVKVTHSQLTAANTQRTSIAVSLLKNSNRFEWFIEKATELGISEIIPLICSRTEKQKFRSDRMKNILVSAMLQSQQVWLPVLHEPIAYEVLFRQEEVAATAQKFIAHCVETDKRNLGDLINESLPSQMVLIGPEGDFTKEEIEMAVQHHFIPVALGETRLRTETAAVVAAAMLKVH
ncbi:MAG: RsmE family RNA methyltransferase [Chitinophagaceae bacterium]